MVCRHASTPGKLPRLVSSKQSTLLRRARKGNQRGESKIEIGLVVRIVRQLRGLDLREYGTQLMYVTDWLKQDDVGNAWPGTIKSSELQGSMN